MSGTPRQAVVFIHGIGEQRPMDTLRGAMGASDVGEFWNKPDRFSTGYELRRFTAGSTRSRPITDFFELYWAYHFDAGRLGSTLGWAGRLLVRRPFWRHDRPLRVAMGVLQVGVLALLAVVLFLFVRVVRADGLSEAVGWVGGTTTTALAVVNLVAGYVVTRVLADAARYLTPTPENIEARNAIRNEGVQLLRALHDSGAYERIVVVGHSLGSVIGLDVLRICFDELRHPDPALPKPNAEAEAFNEEAALLPSTPTRQATERFQQAQRRLWREMRARGSHWLVTDFVTLGSPLAHAPLLLDGKRASLSDRQREGEYPTCPPSRPPFYPLQSTLADGSKRTGLMPDHSAVFAVTTWSNAWFPVGGGFGDPVGGPLVPVFGSGIRDVPVRLDSRRRHHWRELFLLAHTTYFRRDLDADADLADRPPQEDADGRGAAARQARKELDRKVGTRVSHMVVRDFLRLGSKLGAPLPPAPPPRSRP
jgi:hypothetical protein